MTNLGDTLRGWMRGWLFPDGLYDEEWRTRITRYEANREYYIGAHRRQIKVKPDQADDNLTENFIDLVVERSLSMMLGDGIAFEIGRDADQEYIEEWSEANDLQALLHDAVENASVYGTGYAKLLPAGVESQQRDSVMMPRLVVLDPRWMKIVTLPEDIGHVTGYEMRYNVGTDTARKEVTEQLALDELGRVLSWQVTNYIADQSTNGRWQQMGEPVIWEYEFPPIVHWKNLPRANDCYGKPDIDGILELQDRINFVAGNISRVIRYHSHPKTWARGAGVGAKVSWGPDEMVTINDPNGMMANLEMQSDLASSRAFYNDLKATLFDISRTVDIASMRDKVGQLTNFGLRVLYQDALAKTTTKRQLLGRALLEIVHRVLVLDGRDGDPGEIIWPDMLPSNEVEETQGYAFDLSNGLASKETIAERRGYEWETEQERLGTEAQAGDNIGAALLRAFERGGQ